MNTKLGFALVGVLVSLALGVTPGCGDDDDNKGTSGGSAGSSDEPQGFGGNFNPDDPDFLGGNGGSGGSGEAGTGQSQGPQRARVEVSQGSKSKQAYATAYFPIRNDEGDPACSVESVGECRVVTCSLHGASDASAGDITIANAAGDQILLSFKKPDSLGGFGSGGGLYETASKTPPNLLDGGGDISFSAAGDQVSAFAESVPAPTVITVTGPESVLADAVEISASEDLALTWTGGVAGQQVTTSLTTLASSGLVRVNCTFDADKGAGTVPSGALSKLIKTGKPGEVNTLIEVSAATSKDVTLDGYVVTLASVRDDVREVFVLK